MNLSDGLTPPARREGAGRFIQSGSRGYTSSGEAGFEQRLAPYGRWVNAPEYGRVWMPKAVGNDWQPYGDGQWVESHYGWAFASTVPWGWAVYHYGRWGFGMGLGWFWRPGFVWGPAWVSWRFASGFVCWSPLAPRDFVFGRRWPGWVVVPHRRFAGSFVTHWAVPRTRAAAIVREATPIPGMHSVRGGGVRSGGAFHGGGTVHGGGSRGGFHAGPRRRFGGSARWGGFGRGFHAGAPHGGFGGAFPGGSFHAFARGGFGRR